MIIKPPKWTPNAIATKQGWVNPITKELLVSKKGLLVEPIITEKPVIVEPIIVEQPVIAEPIIEKTVITEPVLEDKPIIEEQVTPNLETRKKKRSR